MSGGFVMARTPQTRHLGDVSARPADVQVRFRELMSRAAEAERRDASKPQTIGPYLTVSRQAGSGGAEVARRVGERLGWAVYDRELVDALARKLELAPGMLDLMDETRSNWFNDTLLNLLNSRLVFQDSYVSMIGKIMLLAACDGGCVIVGRAGHLLLPAEFGLRVRVVAPRSDRLKRMSERESIEAESVAARLDRIDESRADFIQRHFHRSPDDPALYDMVVDTGSFGIEGTVELVGAALRIRGLIPSF
jgi:cytidylate kinase